MMAGQPAPKWAPNCQECGMHRGAKPQEHVCEKKQFIAHQQGLWASEIRTKLEPELQDFLASPKGQFTMYLIDNKRL